MKIIINKGFLFGFLIISILVLSSCQQYASIRPGDFELALSEGTCRDGTSIKFIDGRGKVNCNSLSQVVRNEKLSSDFWSKGTTKLWPTAGKDHNSKEFKEALKTFNKLFKLYNIDTPYNWFYQNLKEDGTYSGRVLKTPTLSGCISGHVLKIEYEDGRVECLTSKDIDKRIDRKLGDVFLNPKHKKIFGTPFGFRLDLLDNGKKLVVHPGNDGEDSLFEHIMTPMEDQGHVINGYPVYLCGTPDNPEQGFCGNTADPCCSNQHCLLGSSTVCDWLEVGVEGCQAVGVCGAPVVWSGIGRTCSGTNAGCTGPIEEFIDENVPGRGCGPASMCKYEDPDDTSSFAYCVVDEQHCQQPGVSTRPDGNGGILKYDIETGELLGRSEGGVFTPEDGSRDSHTECEGMKYVGTDSGSGTVPLQFAKCKCSNLINPSDRVISGWYHELEGETSLYAYNSLGCDLSLTCDEEDGVPLCYMTPYELSDEWDDLNEHNFPWTFTNQLGTNSLTITIDDAKNPFDDLDGDGEDDENYYYLNFARKSTNLKLWKAGPCADGYGLYCAGDGYCESSDSEEINVEYNDGEYENYINSPQDCTEHYILNFRISNMANPYGSGAVSDCNDEAGSDLFPWNWWVWNRPSYDWNNYISENAECGTDFTKIYWSNFTHTYIYDGVGENFADGIFSLEGVNIVLWNDFMNQETENGMTSYYMSPMQDGIELDAYVPNWPNIVNPADVYGFNMYYQVTTDESGGLWAGEVCGNTHEDWAHYNFVKTGINLRTPSGIDSSTVIGCDDAREGACNLRGIGVNMGYSLDLDNLWYTFGLAADHLWAPYLWVGDGYICEPWKGLTDTNQFDGIYYSGPCHTSLPEAFTIDGSFDSISGNDDNDWHDDHPDYGSGADNEWLVDTAYNNRFYCCMNTADRRRPPSIIGCVATISA